MERAVVFGVGLSYVCGLDAPVCADSAPVVSDYTRGREECVSQVSEGLHLLTYSTPAKGNVL